MYGLSRPWYLTFLYIFPHSTSFSAKLDGSHSYTGGLPTADLFFAPWTVSSNKQTLLFQLTAKSVAENIGSHPSLPTNHNQLRSVTCAASMSPDCLPNHKTLPIGLHLGSDPSSPPHNFVALHHLSHYATWLTAHSHVTIIVLIFDAHLLWCFEFWAWGWKVWIGKCWAGGLPCGGVSWRVITKAQRKANNKSGWWAVLWI